MSKKHVPRPVKKTTKKHKKNMFCTVLIWTLIIVTGVAFGLLKLLNVIPNDYIIIALCTMVFTSGLLSIGILIKNNIRIVSSLISIILIIIYIVVIIYELYTIFFLNGINNKNNISTENYSVVVLKDSTLNSEKDLHDKNLGVLNIEDEGYNKAIDKLHESINTTKKEYEDTNSLADALLDKNVDAILLDDSLNAILEENYENYDALTRVLYTFSIEVEIEDIAKTKDVTKEPFNIFISGIDTYGNITSVSRSDVNIVATINPNTNEINLTHIPRDYYVTLSGKNSKDKLTHAGIYGIDTSVKTIENILDIDINYYVKVNFTSIINIINAIGDIEVYSKHTFTSGIYDSHMTRTYNYTKGKNTLNGDETLAFVRERHSFEDGDRVRGENQMLVIQAIIKKVTNPSILTNYPKLLSALSKSFVTNMSDEDLTSLNKKQLDDNKSWNINSFVLNGSSAFEYTYSYPRQKLYVMMPDEKSITTAKDNISKVLNAN